MLEGRWKMVIIFHLFARGTLRFSELEKAIRACRRRCDPAVRRFAECCSKRKSRVALPLGSR